MHRLKNLGTPWDARGLTPAERDMVFRLAQTMYGNRARNVLLEQYYAGDVTIKNLGIAVPEQNAFMVLEKVRVDCDWPAIAVDRLADRSMFDGFVLASGSKAQDSLAAVSRQVSRAYRANLPMALVHGCSFWTVGLRGRHSVVHAHSALTSAGLWDETNDRILCGMAIVGTCWDKRWTREVPDRVDVHTPDAVIELTRPDVERDGWVATRYPHPMGRPLMEPLCYRADTRWRFGHSRITRQVRKICDSMMRENLRVEVASELNVLPQKFVLGLTPEQYDALAADRFRNAVGSLFMVAQDEDASQTVNAGQFPQVNFQPHIELKRDLAADFSGVTGIPMSELGVVHDNPSSAEAIEAAEKPLVTLCEHMNDDMAYSLENVAKMALAMEGNTSLDGLDAEVAGLTAHFRDPSMPSLSASTDRAIKIVSAAPEYAQTEGFWIDVGKDEGERRSIMGDLRKMQARIGRTAVLDRNRDTDETRDSEQPGGGTLQAQPRGRA